MKILMIAPQPFFQPRGTPFSVLHRLTALSKLGYHVDLVTYHLGQEVDIKNVTIHRARRVPWVKEIAIGPSKTKLLLDVLIYRRAVELLRQQRYDLIHTHEEAGFLGIHLSRKFGTLHLYDMHSSLPQQLSNFKYSSARALLRLFERLEAATINSAHAVITICPELFNYVKTRFPKKYNKLIENVADNAIVFGKPDDSLENSNGRSKAVALAHQYGLTFKDEQAKSNGAGGKNGETIILYTGTFEPYQGVDLLIESSQPVIGRHANVRFLVVGGKPEQVAFYKEKADKLGVSEKFIFTGQRPPEEIPQFMRLADILVSPRVAGNNTPLKIYSYLRSGIPIVATDHITHTQVLNAEVAVLTDCTPPAFAEGILRVLDNRAYGEALARKAQELAAREYSYEAYLQKTREIYTYLESLL
ncbi:MAG: glycosyltransferase family 4 protein [candidate division KSB1 bacterium]|nr:glycosyltransferase family 4 protein [candidate division KSB1 bacterium]MDZ7303576.1 glycosyltransferase family 4 protein [candidate division KSB1 bacterium]MDZ7312819.1 glycosyltransferase family 4 protein [candidate division KSB1 bacterium]